MEVYRLINQNMKQCKYMIKIEKTANIDHY